jgi:hypothetical protein
MNRSYESLAALLCPHMKVSQRSYDLTPNL